MVVGDDEVAVGDDEVAVGDDEVTVGDDEVVVGGDVVTIWILFCRKTTLQIFKFILSLAYGEKIFVKIHTTFMEKVVLFHEN